MVSIVRIDEAQVEMLCASQESHFLDFKRKEISPKNLTKTISAFANSDGGEIYVGVAEDTWKKEKVCSGFLKPEEANAILQEIEKIFPLCKDVQCVFLEKQEPHEYILKIEINKTRDIKRTQEERVYIRRGAQNIPVDDPAAIRQLEYMKGIASFENQLVNAEIKYICNSTPVIEFMLGVVPHAEPEGWLKKQCLIQEDRPTVAGVLLFSDEPQAFLPKRSGIKIYRYTTKDREGARETLAFDPMTVEGWLYKQIHDAVELTGKMVEQAGRMGIEGVEAVFYPTEAIHEIITNAVLHRDYSIADDIHIKIFDNRIEVQSPGRLPAHITPENILDERFSRNGAIVRIINKFPTPPNKDIGEGLNTAFNAMHKMGLKSPTIENIENAVLVTIKHEPLASPEIIILEYLEVHDSIKNKTAREICHIQADYIIKEKFRELVERELMERIPGTRTASTAYRKGPKFSEWKKSLQVEK